MGYQIAIMQLQLGIGSSFLKTLLVKQLPVRILSMQLETQRLLLLEQSAQIKPFVAGVRQMV